MPPEITPRAADMPGDLDRLRGYATAQRLERTLERHLAQPRYRPALTRIIDQDGTLAALALIGHRRLRLGAALFEVGAVEALHVRDPRDADLFEALLGDCLGTLIDQGLPIVTLHGSSARYAPFGFAAYRFHSAVELRGAAGAGIALRAAAAGDLDDLAALHQASYQGLALTDERAAPDWRAWIEQHAALTLEDTRGRVVGYAALAAGQTGGPLAIDEAAAADAGAARQLCGALLDRAGKEELAGIELQLAPWHPVAQAALHMGGTARLRAPADDKPAALAGVVDLMGALEALAPEFERRLAHSRYAGWSGSLRLELATERFTLAFDQGRATVIDGQRPADLRLRQIELPALAQLCLGFRAAADLRATGGLACDDAALGLIDALFPTVLATE
jgi:hypothetical protein